MSKTDTATLASMVLFGKAPTNDDLLLYRRNKCLMAALNAITRLMLGGNDKVAALADVPTEDGGTVADLPAIVATSISKPYGSLGLDSSPEWGATTSDWYLFQHQAEDFIRWKIDRARMRKLDTTAQRLHLALGCLQWAGVLGVRDVPGFQSHFTTALIFDRDATSELNGETIDVAPLETDTPLTNAMLSAIVEMLKRQGTEIGALRQDFANLGDEIFDAVGKERIPPDWKEIDEHSRRDLYEKVKIIKATRTNKRGALDRFMDATTWRFRGFTVREIFKDTSTLNNFYNAERMKIARPPKRGNT